MEEGKARNAGSRGNGPARWRAVAPLAFLLLIVSSPAGAFRFDARGRVWRFETAPRCELVLSTAIGDISVDQGPPGEIVVRAQVAVHAPSKYAARRIASRIDFDISPSPDRVSVRATLPSIRKTGLFGGMSGGRTSVAVHYRVTVPPRTSLVLESKAGDIVIRGVEGNFDVMTGRGDIRAHDIAGRGGFRTGGGEVDCRLARLDAGAGLVLRSFGGSVLLAVPESTNARLDAESRDGRVRVDIDLSSAGKRSLRRVDGVIGDGNGRIVVRAAGGSVGIVPR